jgi:hypothetical protein
MSTLAIEGTITELPAAGVARVIDLRVALARAAERRVIPLTSDSAVVVNLDGWTGINVLVIESDTKITARITSADGTDKDIPVDDLLLLVSRATPITALSLVRVAGQSATVTLTLGQEA